MQSVNQYTSPPARAFIEQHLYDAHGPHKSSHVQCRNSHTKIEAFYTIQSSRQNAQHCIIRWSCSDFLIILTQESCLADAWFKAFGANKWMEKRGYCRALALVKWCQYTSPQMTLFLQSTDWTLYKRYNIHGLAPQNDTDVPSWQNSRCKHIVCLLKMSSKFVIMP